MRIKLFRLTTFELLTNVLLTLCLVFILNFQNRSVYFKSSAIILTLFYLRYGLPFDFMSNITIYSNKIENIVWHSIILLMMYINRNKFNNDLLSVFSQTMLFIYFNIMRFLGELYIGKDPIWTGKNYRFQYYSESKKRLTTKKDFSWTLLYFCVGITISLLLANRKVLF